MADLKPPISLSYVQVHDWSVCITKWLCNHCKWRISISISLNQVEPVPVWTDPDTNLELRLKSLLPTQILHFLLHLEVYSKIYLVWLQLIYLFVWVKSYDWGGLLKHLVLVTDCTWRHRCTPAVSGSTPRSRVQVLLKIDDIWVVSKWIL